MSCHCRKVVHSVVSNFDHLLYNELSHQNYSCTSIKSWIYFTYVNYKIALRFVFILRQYLMICKQEATVQ